MIYFLKLIIPKRFHKKMDLYFHSGNNYVCPYCNYSCKDFSPIGFNFPVLHERKVVGGGKRLAGCYNCRSTDRERLIYVVLKEIFNLIDGDLRKNILHIAPERNLSALLLKKRFKQYICGDLYSKGYSYQKHVKNINVLDIPYDNETFDFIICNHVLEHIPDDYKAMKEINRVLKKSGKAILQVPISKNTEKTIEDLSIIDPKQRETTFGQYDHVRLYGQDYIKRLSISGFMVTRINISEEYSQYGLNKDEDVFICEKLQSA